MTVIAVKNKFTLAGARNFVGGVSTRKKHCALKGFSALFSNGL
jgi:hypothetical protein